MLKPQFRQILQKDLQAYLGFMKALVLLLTDENTAIQEQACRIVYSDAAEVIKNPNVALHRAFDLIFSDLVDHFSDKSQKNALKLTDSSQILNYFICNLVCQPYIETKSKSSGCSRRIFQFEDPNKSREELKLMTAILKSLSKLPFAFRLQQEANEATNPPNFILSSEAQATEIKEYIKNPLRRDASVFKLGIYEVFKSKILNNAQPTNHINLGNWFTDFLE